MHEAKLVADLVGKIDAVARDNGAPPVRTIRIEIGALSHVTPESLEGQFEVLAHGSAAQDAHLEVITSTDRDAPHASEVRLVSIVVEEA